MNIALNPAHNQAIADTLIREMAATAVNPRPCGRKLYSSLLVAGYYDEAFQLLDERLAKVPWGVYRVGSGKPELLFAGPHDRALHAFQVEAHRAGKLIESEAGVCRFHVSTDDMVVVAPILASDRAGPARRVAAPVPIRKPRRTRLVVQPRNILAYRL